MRIRTGWAWGTSGFEGKRVRGCEALVPAVLAACSLRFLTFVPASLARHGPVMI